MTRSRTATSLTSRGSITLSAELAIGTEPTRALPTEASAASGLQLAEAPFAPEQIAAVEQQIAEGRSSNTVRAYASDWARFTRWCEEKRRNALPASAETLTVYLSEQSKIERTDGKPSYSPNTIGRWVSAINAAHRHAGLPAPGDHHAVRALMTSIRRNRRTPTKRVTPLLLEPLTAVLSNVELTAWPDGILAIRDSALLLMGFTGAFRSDELAMCEIGHVTLHREDGMHVRVPFSKTDQEGDGMIKGLPFSTNRESSALCPPCAYLRWLRVLDAALNEERSVLMKVVRETTTEGHIHNEPVPQLARLDERDRLFRSVRRGGHISSKPFSGGVVRLAVRRQLERAGFDPTNFASHSLRAGFVTQADRVGADPWQIMRQTGHKNIATVEIYRRESNPLRGNAVTKIGI